MGNQPYFINLICKKLEEKLISKNNREFDLRLLYGKETSVSEILETVKSYPMFGETACYCKRSSIFKQRDQSFYHILKIFKPNCFSYLLC